MFSDLSEFVSVQNTTPWINDKDAREYTAKYVKYVDTVIRAFPGGKGLVLSFWS